MPIARAATPVMNTRTLFDLILIFLQSHGSRGLLVAENSSLDELIRFAYQLKDYQISGPSWLNADSECFDVQAKAPVDTSKKQVRLMLQALLEERFKLATHRETRLLASYELLPAKSGAKLQATTHPDQRATTSSAGGDVKATNVSMTEFAYQLSRFLGRPVLDKTDIKGAFDFAFRYDVHTGGEGPSLFRALQQQL